MRSIMVLNPKGGCGKTTLATNLASYFAQDESTVVLADFDPQASSMDWLSARPAEYPEIKGWPAYDKPLRPSKNTDYLIIDPPARVHRKELSDLVRRAETILIPVLPSAMDMRAAQHYINEELLRLQRVADKRVKLALVANRVREYTLSYQELDTFLDGFKIPVLTHLRDTQNYVKAAERGMGIFELPPHMVYTDLEQWEPLLQWVTSRRSLPRNR